MHVPDQSPGARACVCCGARRAKHADDVCIIYDFSGYDYLFSINVDSFKTVRPPALRHTGSHTGAHAMSSECVCVRVITFSSAATDATRPMDIDIARAT